MNDFNPLQTQTIVSHAFIAIFGGLVHALNAHRHGDTKGLGDIAVLSIISSFSGIIFALASMYFFQNTYLTLAIAGSGGYVGVEGLGALSKKLQGLLTSKI